MLTQQQRLLLTHRLYTLARTNFVAFLTAMYPQGVGRPYVLTKFHLALADHVQQMSEGAIGPHQSISAPPQHGKSQLLAVRTVAWLVGRYPGINIALTGFSRSLLVGFLAGAKEIIESRAYQRIFPSLHALPGYDRSDFIRLSNNSTVIVKSAGSKLTGRGADWLIVDDAHAGRAEAESDILRQKVITWFKSDCLTRISPSAKILVIGTRFHKEDLIGTVGSEAFARALEDAGQGHRRFQHTNFQAIYDGRNPDPLGRTDGDPLAPETRPMDFLKGQQAMLFGYEWDAQYQGNPGAYTVGQVDVSKLQYCNAADVPKDIRRTRGWDTALSEKQTADYTAGARCSADDGYFYIEDVTAFRAAWPVARKKISELALKEKETHGIHRIGVEGVAGFGVVVQSLRELLLGEVSVTQRNPPKGGKLLRAQPWLVKIEAGKVVLVRGAWNAAFVRELEQFPNGSHDDMCDATSVAFEELFHTQRLLLA